MILPDPLKKLSTDELAVLEEHSKIIQFPAGSCIFKEGEAGDSCYIIESGRVRIELDTPEIDSDNVLAYLDPGMILGEMSILDRKPRSASAYADTDVTVRRISTEDIDNLCEFYPKVATSIIMALGRDAALKIREMNKRQATIISEGQECDPEVEELVSRAMTAQKEIQDWPEDKIDALLHDMAQAVAERAEELALAAVEGSHLGNAPDKVEKIKLNSLGLYQYLAGKPGSGYLSFDEENKVAEFASPVGIVFDLVPAGNPVCKPIFSAMICVKSRNSLIMSFSHAAQNVGAMVGEIIQEALRSQSAPVDLIQWVKQRSSRKKAEMFMRHENVSLILATGGPSMVKAAYSSGTPAIGVAPGNAPALICGDADIQDAAHIVVTSRAFDNGLHCCAEKNLVVVNKIYHKFIEVLESEGAAVLTPEEEKRFSTGAFEPQTHSLRMEITGRSAATIADQYKIKRDYPIKLIVVPTEGVDSNNPYCCYEKLAPVVSLFTVEDEEDGMDVCFALLKIFGIGHTAIIHSKNTELIKRFGARMPASRIVVNASGAVGAAGSGTGLVPSCILSCGTLAGNSTSDNITYRHLLNIKRIAYPKPMKNKV
jgi:acyl-CoA reductase-like NAD-dependent aldehyde dehydrogenase